MCHGQDITLDQMVCLRKPYLHQYENESMFSHSGAEERGRWIKAPLRSIFMELHSSSVGQHVLPKEHTVL